MNPYNFSILFFAFCTFFISVLILFRRQDPVGGIYFVFSCFVTVWAIGLAITISQSSSYDLALLSIRIADGAAIFISTTWYHFVLIFTGHYQKCWKRLFVFYGLSGLIIFFIFDPLFIPIVAPSLSFNYYKRAGILFYPFTALYFLVVLMGFSELSQRLKFVSSVEKKQLLGFMIATGTGFLGGGLTLLPAYGIEFPQHFFFLFPIYPFVMAYYMERQSLFTIEDIAKLIRRDRLAAMGVMSASMNHEMRNPLYVIQGLSQSYIINLEEKKFTKEKEAILKAKETMAKIDAQACRAMEIIKQFSVFAKRQVDFSDLKEAVSLKEVFDSIILFVRHDLDLNGMILRVDIPDDFPRLLVNRAHLEEVLLNLITNARQSIHPSANRQGSIFLEAKSRQDKAVLTIADNGEGIAADNVGRIFQPFYTTKKEGTGLGLYITKKLVERNYGTICVETEINKGTKFILTFLKSES